MRELIVAISVPRRTKWPAARLVFMPKKIALPMGMQPQDDGRDLPRPMTSRVKAITSEKTERNDKARCAVMRGDALAKQRAALGEDAPAKSA